MFAALLFSVVAIESFCPPHPWALGFAAGPRIPLAGDVDGDGYADMIAIYPEGDCIIDVSLTVDGQKTGGGFQARTRWGRNCQAATAGEFDDKPGADVVGMFDGDTLRLAGSFANGRFQDTPNWIKFPAKLKKPQLVTLQRGAGILAYSTENGAAYRVDVKSKTVTAVQAPIGMKWIGDAGIRLVGQDRDGHVWWIDRDTLKRGDKLGDAPKDSIPAATDNLVAFGKLAWTPTGMLALEDPKLPPARTIRVIGDFDKDGDPDVLEVRYGTEMHTANEILLRRAISPGETDWDHDGLTNEEEIALGTDPKNPDTDGDGLLDGWEVHGYRGLDLKAMGCDPKHVDLVCLISRYDTVPEAHAKTEIDRVIKFYQDLKTPNPDGKTGFAFHPVWLDTVKAPDHGNAWYTNRAKFRPEKWRGVVHWMQINPGGGGQADELGDGGGVGANALWAVFVHEFGHQLGLPHDGFWNNGLCPIYPSLMNYAYSYGFEDDYNKIHYSDGALVGYVLRETDLDETIPLPYEKVKFLEKAPYHFRLKPNGKTTLIDWNWNGIFGEKHIRADINYSYSTNAGRRDDVGKSKTAPWLFVHKNRAFVLFGTNDVPADPKVDPTLSEQRPGRIVLKRLRKPFEWDVPWTLESGGTVGDPVAVSVGDDVAVAYQTVSGVVLRWIQVNDRGVTMSNAETIADDRSMVPTVGTFGGVAYLFLWNPATGKVTYRALQRNRSIGTAREFVATSENPVGMCEDTISHEAVLALAQKQDARRDHRWQIRRYKRLDDTFVETGMDWIEGEKGGAAGTGRMIPLFDASRDAGPNGRIYVYAKGLTSEKTPWNCTYVAHQVADKTVHGGWMVKRYYDEWTQSRSAPAAAWFQNDVIWSYRWVDGGQGATDNNLHVGYKGLGIQDEPMGDHDDLTFLRTFGVRHCLLALGRE